MGSITSAPAPGKSTTTMYQLKSRSVHPDDRAETRIAELLAAQDNKVHFTDGVGKADLQINGVLADVKHLAEGHSSNIRSAIQRSAHQGSWVILDGTTVALTEQVARMGIEEFERVAQVHPGPVALIGRIFIVLGNGTDLLEHVRKPSVEEMRWQRGRKISC